MPQIRVVVQRPQRITWRERLLAITAVVLSSSYLSAQPGQTTSAVLVGTVLTSEGIPLPNTVVSIPRLDVERFTDQSGSFVLNRIPTGKYLIRIRRLGFLPKEMEVIVRLGEPDTLRIALTKLAVQLTAVNVIAHPACKHPGPPHEGDDVQLITAFTQLMMNAEQYRALVRAFPFSYMMRFHQGHSTNDGVVSIDQVDSALIDALQQWRYRPGSLLERRRASAREPLFLKLPTLAELADTAFINSHCFHDGGLVDRDGATLYRIDFLPAIRIRSTDVEGSIYLDTSNYQIRYAMMRPSPLPRVTGLQEMEVVMEFQETFPSIPLLGKVSSRQKFDTRVRGVTYPMTFEEQRLINVHFVRSRPAQGKR